MLTYCRICEAACGLEAQPADSGPPTLRPDRAHPVSRGFVCAKGTRFGEVAFHPSRVTHPAIRRRGALERVSWSAALDEAATRLRRVMDEHGPHSVALYVGNPLAFHALGQVAAVFFGRALGTRNVFSAGSQDCNNKFAAAALVHGSPTIHPVPDFDHAELAVCFGTNPAVSQASFVHLEGGAGVFDRMKARGARVVWVDVRRTESAKRWGELLTVRPGTDVWLILALLGLLADRAPDDDRVEGLDVLLSLATEITPARAAAVTGVDEADIRALATSIAQAKGCALHMSVGVNQGPFGTLSYVALQALSFVAGHFDRAGGSLFNPLAVHGARVARAVGLFTSEARSRVGDFPMVFDTMPGGVLADEMLLEGPERVRALVVIAGDPLRSIPGARRLEEAVKRLDTVVALDLFESRTARHADVFLPATSWLERADFALPGLPLSTLDLLQTSEAVIDRVGQARPEHEVLAALSLALGRPLFGSRWASRALATPHLVDRVLPKLAHLAWRLADGDPARRGYGVPIPAPRERTYLGKGPMTPGARVRFWHPDLEGERARLLAFEPRLGAVRGDGDFVLVGRRRRIGHNSWLHGGTRGGKAEPEAWLAPADMRRLGLEDGSEIHLATDTGQLRLPALARDGVAEGTVVVPHGELDVNVNELLPAGVAHIEPLSGMLHMTGVPVAVRAVTTLGADATA